MNARLAYFVTGTDTEVGKTLVSCALLHALGQAGLRAVCMKPVAAGAVWRDERWHNDDADALAESAGAQIAPELATPYLLRTAAAPHIAAEIDGISIDLNIINECYQQIATNNEAVVVEGIGGFCVPLGPTHDTADMAVQFCLPVVLVVGMRLGCLNHALLTAEAVAARGLLLAGWVANMIDPAMSYPTDNVAALSLRLPAPLLGVLPHMADASVAQAVSHLDFSALPGWPGKLP